MDLRLKDLLKIKTCTFEFKGHESLLNKKADQVSIDSRTIHPGDIYIAIKGENHDGHHFALAALKKQALAVVINHDFWFANKNELEGKPVFVVRDTTYALQQIANFYRKKFSIPVIGITGTNGKTTTKEMIAAVLEKSGKVCKTEGNFNNHIGVPLTLLKLTKEHKYAVIEMGTNHFGEIKTLCEIAEPDFGIITNIGHGHTEFLQDINGVTKAKMELFDYLKINGGTVFINMEDSNISKFSEDFLQKKTFGFSGTENTSAQKIGINETGCARIKIEDTEISLNLPGVHNAINALAAIAVGIEFRVNLAEIKNALENLNIPSKRMEVLTENGITVINDCYNANPESTLSALKTLAGFNVSGIKYFIFGDMLELGENAEEQHAEIGRSINGFGVTAMFTYGDLAKEAGNAAQATITRKHFTDKTDLTARLKTDLKPGDLVLLKGSRGMKMEEILEGIFN